MTTKTQPKLPEIGERIRFAIEYGGGWRPLGWLRAGKDGSIYVGLLMGKPTVARAADKAAGRITELKYDELKDLDRVPESSRLSFHPSGEVHVGDKVVRGLVPLRELKKPLQLCMMLFTHPSKYVPPRRKDADDFDLGISGYQVDEERPMYGAIVVTPWRNGINLPSKLPNMTQFVGTVVGLRGFTNSPDLLIEIILGHGPKGQWPVLPVATVISRG